ncbi:hypothetical protein [Limnoglobus roseus]|uniref:Uncharacterized protein n=1 Tax=Limnoglobus roseus TaxID=2598579 RepID=A0A5C1AU26_9BACT|nr:hypothetical protein [Limnoglobus roseus]QEL21102.1 hypothetical protein PX52LOC_08231 [Limnoglobus roseus]
MTPSMFDLCALARSLATRWVETFDGGSEGTARLLRVLTRTLDTIVMNRNRMSPVEFEMTLFIRDGLVGTSRPPLTPADAVVLRDLIDDAFGSAPIAPLPPA